LKREDEGTGDENKQHEELEGPQTVKVTSFVVLVTTHKGTG
jgi:hypothetical protein